MIGQFFDVSCRPAMKKKKLYINLYSNFLPRNSECLQQSFTHSPERVCMNVHKKLLLLKFTLPSQPVLGRNRTKQADLLTKHSTIIFSVSFYKSMHSLQNRISPWLCWLMIGLPFPWGKTFQSFRIHWYGTYHETKAYHLLTIECSGGPWNRQSRFSHLQLSPPKAAQLRTP